MIPVTLSDDTVIVLSSTEAATYPLLAPFLDQQVPLCLPLTATEYQCLTHTPTSVLELAQRLQYADRVDQQTIYCQTLSLLLEALLANPESVAAQLVDYCFTPDQEADLVATFLQRHILWLPLYQVTSRGSLASSSPDGRLIKTSEGEYFVDGQPAESGPAILQVGEQISPRGSYYVNFAWGDLEIRSVDGRYRVNTPIECTGRCYWSGTEDSIAMWTVGNIILHFNHRQQQRTEIATPLGIIATTDRYLVLGLVNGFRIHQLYLVWIENPERLWKVGFSIDTNDPRRPPSQVRPTVDDNLLISVSGPAVVRHTLVRLIDYTRRKEISWSQLLVWLGEKQRGVRLLQECS